MKKTMLIFIIGILCICLVSCINSKASNDGVSESGYSTDAFSETTEPETSETVTTATETEKASIFENIDEKYLKKLRVAGMGINAESPFPDILENASEGELFEVTIDLVYKVDTEAADAYAYANATDPDEVTILRRKYIKDWYNEKEEAFLERYNLEVSENTHLGYYSPYIGSITLSVPQIIEIIQDDDVWNVSYRNYEGDRPGELFGGV